MVVAVALWSLELKPGKPESVIPPADLRITNAALGEELADEKSRTSVKLTYQHPGGDDEEDEEEDDEEAHTVTTVLCSLTPNKIEQSTIDLILESDEEVLFEVTGKNSVFLTGNFVDQNPAAMPEDDSDDEGYDLNDVSSDVEFDASELDEAELEDDSHRFEEIHDEEPASSKKADSKKRPRESDASEEKLSKAEQKKLNKKLKAEGGKAVAAGEKTESKEKTEEKKPKGADKTKEGPKDGVPSVKSEAKTIAGGVKYQDHKLGSGKTAKAGDMVHVRYVGKLTNGKMFDSNTKGAPFKFRLGKGEVIKGWDVGVAGMQIGGERLITIPPAMAYGKRAQPGIPGNSTLVFEVKLVKIA